MKKADKGREEITDTERKELERLTEDKEFNQRLSKLEKEYQEIKIPDELKGRVIQAMQEARNDAKAEPDASDKKMEEDPRMNRIRRKQKDKKTAVHYLLRTTQTAAAALLVITVLANTNAQTAYAMGKIPVIGAITKVVTFRTYEKQNENSEAKVEVPQIEAAKDSGISNAADQVNKSVEEYTNQVIAQFEEDVKRDGEEAHLGVYTEYKVLADNNRFFTLKIETDEIMASGYQTVKIYNIDKKSDKILQLKDMFPEGTDYVTLLSNAAKEVMQKNMQEDEDKVYFLNDEMGADFDKIKEDQNFYIDDAGRMVLVFDEYEVAPGFMGIVEITIPETIYHADGL